VPLYSTQYYEKTGKCKFGAKCRFNHPKDNEVPTMIGRQTIYTANIDAEVYNGTTNGSIPAKKHTSAAPAEAHNAKGLPIRPVWLFLHVCVSRSKGYTFISIVFFFFSWISTFPFFLHLSSEIYVGKSIALSAAC
jgi:hypothetical protein